MRYILMIMAMISVMNAQALPDTRATTGIQHEQELTVDAPRFVSSDAIITYKPNIQLFEKDLAVTGGFLNNKIAVGAAVFFPLFDRHAGERFGIETDEGLEAHVSFLVTSGKMEAFAIPGISYSIHAYGWELVRYVIISPGLQAWLGTSLYPALTLNIGAGI